MNAKLIPILAALLAVLPRSRGQTTYTFNASSPATWDTSTVEWLVGGTPTAWVNGATNDAVVSIGSVDLGVSPGITAHSLSTLGTSSLSGSPLTLAGTSPFLSAGGDRLFVNVVIAGSSGVSVQGGGRLILQQAATYTGATSVAVGAVLSFTADDLLPSATDLIVPGGASVDLNGTMQGVASLSGGGTIRGNTAATSTLAIGGAGGATFTGTLADGSDGGLAVTMAGTGTQIMAPAISIYGKGTTIRSGTLVAAAANAFGSGAVSVGSGGTWGLQGGSALSNSGTISGSGAAGRSGAIDNLAGSNALSGSLTLAAAAAVGAEAGNLTLSGGISTAGFALTLAPASGSTVTISSGAITGGGALNLTGAGGAVLAASGSSAGTTTVSTGTLTVNGGAHASVGELDVRDSGAMTVSGTGTQLTTLGVFVGATNGGSLTVQGGAELNTGDTAFASGGSADAVTVTGAGTVWNAGRIAVGQDTTGDTLTVADGAQVNASGLELDLLTHGTNPSVHLDGGSAPGVLSIPNFSGSLGGGSLVFDGGELQLTQSGDIDGSSGIPLQVQLSAGGASIDTQAFSSTITHGMQGVGGLTKLGSGTLLLSGANTYSGGTTVSAGTLKLGKAQALGTGAVTVSAGATLDLNGFQQAIPAVSGAGAVAIDGGGLSLGADNSSATVGMVISGAGSLTKKGTGTLTLSGAETFTGTVNVSAGTLAVNGSLPAGSVTHVFAGATLAGSGAVAGNVVLHDGATLAPGLTITGTLTRASDPLVLVPNEGSNNLAVFSTDPDGALRSVGQVAVPHGQIQSGVAVRGDQAFAYAPASAPSAVLVIDLHTLQVVQSVAVTGSARWMALSPDGSRLYATSNQGVLAAFSVDPLSGTLSQLYSLALSSGSLNEIAMDATGSQLYVAVLDGPGGLLFVDAATGSIRRTVTSGVKQAFVAVNPATGIVYAAPLLTPEIQAIDPSTGLVVATAALAGSISGLSVSRDGAYYYAGFAGTHGIAEYRASDNTLAGTYAMSSTPQVGSVSLDGSALFAALGTQLNGLSIDATTHLLSAGTTASASGTLGLAVVAANGNGMLAAGAEFVADRAGALATTGAAGPVFAGGTLVVNGTNLSFLTPMSLSSAGGTVDTQANSASIASVISGAGGLSKVGSGVLTLSGANTYTGGTTVSAGTLQLGAGGSLAAAGALEVDGGTFDLNGQSQTVASLSGTGGVITLGAGALTVNQSGPASFAGAISGTGGLTKSGAGTLTLSGADSYSGGTLISAGTLNLTGSLPNSDVTVASGASLTGSGTVHSLTLGAGATFHATLASASSYTQLTAGSVALGGATLSVTLAGGYVPTVGTVFTLMPGTVTGTFGGLPGGSVFAVGGVYFQVGYHSVDLTVINPPPVITSGAAASATLGGGLNYAITATNVPTGYSIVSGTLPDGLALNAGTGVISGTPTADGTTTITIGASNLAGLGTQTLSITVVSEPRSPATIAFGNLGFAYDGSAKAATVTTNPAGLTTAITYARATSGALDAAGRPVGAGTYTVTATITDFHYFGAVSGTLTIAQAAPTVGWSAPAPITVGTALSSAQLNASGSVPGTLSYSPAAGTVPAAGSQVLSVRFTPNDTANYQTVTATVALVVNLVSGAFTLPAIPTLTTRSGPVTLPATTPGGLPLTYTVISGPATVSGGVLTLTGAPGTVVVQASQAGDATHAAASATLTFGVLSANVLVNVSSLGTVTATEPLIAGFVIGGGRGAAGAGKTVLIRGIGPALGGFGIAGALTTPVLQLFDGQGNFVETNRGWSGGTATLAVFSQVGAFPLAAGSADSAAVATLAPGSYSIVITGANGAGGVAMAEVYDADASPLASQQRVVNLSTRSMVSAGQPLVAGFVVSGSAPKQVLVRGIGPGLTAFGVQGALADPQLALFDSSGKRIAENDNWSTPVATAGSGVGPAIAAEVATAAASAGAFAVAPGGADSAVLVTLAPGAYTAQVTGANGAGGVALVEIYEIN